MAAITIKNYEFLQSTDDWRKCPAAPLPEYAFVGRSNVGKSSLINMLVNNRKLAKTSSKPGKTQTINHYIIDKSWYLVDLPGYGYASASKTMRSNWVRMISDYLQYRKNLQLVFVLIDSRLEPQQKDLDFINGLGEMQIPFALIFTKTDKLSLSAVRRNCQQFTEQLLKTWESLPDIFLSSSVTGSGRVDILSYIDKINTDFNRHTILLK